MLKSVLKKIIPTQFFVAYHFFLAVFANCIYRFPSRRLTVIGVTGTNGKTTTCNLVWHILQEAGCKTGLTTSINFKIGEKEWTNTTKQGMQGRFRLQKLLRQMVREGCTHAVVETTSEGIKQFRHWGIAYNVAVFTNLTPEHIESHGSFEKYKEAKGKLFAALKGKGVSVVNGDDEYAEYFLKFPAGEKWVYGLNFQFSSTNFQSNSNAKIFKPTVYSHTTSGAQFTVKIGESEYTFKTKLLGEFNIYNCLAAIAAGLSQKIDIETIKRALEKVAPVPGRMEIIRDATRDITVVVDYAHDPAALGNVYKTLEESNVNGSPYAKASGDKQMSNVIAVLGAVGGGRDKAKRPLLGALASRYAKYVIITNEDPYDDDPVEIMNHVEAGVIQDAARKINENYWKILDRRSAIQKAISLARPGDIIALTGKGCEEVMAVKGGFVPWDDRVVVGEVLAER